MELKEAADALAQLEGVAADSPAPSAGRLSGPAAEAVAALQSLGHNRSEAERRVVVVLETTDAAETSGSPPAVEDLVREALRV